MNQRLDLCQRFENLRSKSAIDPYELIKQMIREAISIGDKELELAFRYEGLKILRDEGIPVKEILPLVISFCEDCCDLCLYENAARGYALVISCVHKQSIEESSKIISELYVRKAWCLEQCKGEKINAAAALGAVESVKNDEKKEVSMHKATRRAYRKLFESRMENEHSSLYPA